MPVRAAAIAAAIAIAAVVVPAGAHTGFWDTAPGIAPAGANNPDCTSTKPPVILVHGTLMDMTTSWQLFSAGLQAAGYCVWALDLPERGSHELEPSMEVLAAFTHHVLEQTGAARVSLVGHSQGGTQIRHMLLHAENGLGGKVEDAISLAGSHFGTQNAGADWVYDCPACVEQKESSPFYAHLNGGDLTPGGASYTQIATAYDWVVTPFTNALLPEEPGTVTNVVLQDLCPHDPAEHLGIIYDPYALDWVLNALSTAGPADPAYVPPGCGLAP